MTPERQQEVLKRQFENGCLHKKAYKSKVRAEIIRDAVGNKRLEGTEPYSCKFCGMWHLGHPAKWMVRVEQ